MVVSVVIVSPAQTGSPHSNSWLPWSMRAKLMPTSGSRIAGATEPVEKTTANIGGATTSRKPAACAAFRSWCTGLNSPTAFAYSRIFSRPISYSNGAYVLPFWLSSTAKWRLLALVRGGVVDRRHVLIPMPQLGSLLEQPRDRGRQVELGAVLPRRVQHEPRVLQREIERERRRELALHHQVALDAGV